MPLAPLLGVTLLAGGALFLLSACGEPPQPLPTSPPYSELPSGMPPGSPPSVPVGLPTATGAPLPTGLVAAPGAGGYPGNPLPNATVPTTAATTVSPKATPKHAPKCTGEPTGAQILALVEGKSGIPKTGIKVLDGPHCASDWSFTSIGEADKSADQQDALFVVALGTGADLALVTAGSDVCNAPVRQQAPAGIRVLACGF